jgi:hypothetical protein
MDHPTWRGGPDKQVPPNGMDDRTLCSGRDKRVRPKVAETQPPLHPPARGGNMQSPSPRVGRVGEGLDSWRGVLVTPVRRGMPVMPDEAGWMIKRCAADATSASLRKADPTSGSLREQARRGMFVMPKESGWIVQRCATDATSASLREADLTSGSLQNCAL